MSDEEGEMVGYGDDDDDDMIIDDDDDDDDVMTLGELTGLPDEASSSSSNNEDFQEEPIEMRIVTGLDARTELAKQSRTTTRILEERKAKLISKGKEEDDDDDDGDESSSVVSSISFSSDDDEDGDPGNLIAMDINEDIVPPDSPSLPQQQQQEEEEEEAMIPVKLTEQEQLEHIGTISSEKDRLLAMHELLETRIAERSDDNNVSSSSLSPRLEIPSMFPHKKDLERIDSYVKTVAYSFTLNGTITSGLTDDQTPKWWDSESSNGIMLYSRCVQLRQQVLDAFKKLCKGNPHMTKIADIIGSCKLIVSNSGNRKLIDEVDAYCPWTMELVTDTSDAIPVAFVPIRGSFSHSSAIMSEEPLARGVMVLLTKRFVNILKCIHTIVFFVDYLNIQITRDIEKYKQKMVLDRHLETPSQLKNDDVWKELFERKQSTEPPVKMKKTVDEKRKRKKRSSEAPIPSIQDYAKEQLKACCETLRTIFPDETFIVISDPNPDF